MVAEQQCEVYAVGGRFFCPFTYKAISSGAEDEVKGQANTGEERKYILKNGKGDRGDHKDGRIFMDVDK